MLHDSSGPTWRQTCFLPCAAGGLERFEVAIAVLGRFSSLGGFRYHSERQREPCVSLTLVHAGEGTVEMGGRAWRAGPGSVFCWVNDQVMRYRDHPGKPWRYTWAWLVGRRAHELAAALGGGPGPWCRHDLPLRRVLGLLDEIEATFRADRHSRFYPQAAAWRLIDGLAPADDAAGDRAAHLAVAVRRILEAQFASPLKLGALARRLGVDRSTVFRRFQALYGEPPKAFLDRLRLEHARALLRDGALGVTEVAARCGYSGPRPFADAFRRRFGASPSRHLPG